jgi:hypothetical protein
LYIGFFIPWLHAYRDVTINFNNGRIIFCFGKRKIGSPFISDIGFAIDGIFFGVPQVGNMLIL